MSRRTLGTAAAVAILLAGGLELPAADAVLPGVTVPVDSSPLCGTVQPAGGGPAVADDGVLRAATLNLLHSDTDEGDVSLGDRLPLLAGAIAGSGADIVGAQEVTRNLAYDPADESPQKHGLVARRLAQSVADLTGQPWSWCWSLSNPHVPGTPDLYVGGGNPLDQQAAASGNFPESGDFSEGLAVLSRFPIAAASFRRLLPRSYEAAACLGPDPFCYLDATFDSRQVLYARVVTPGGAVDAFTTHIAHHITDLSTTTKEWQARQVVGVTEELARPGALPDLLMGDFNSTPTSAAVGIVTTAGFVDGFAAAGGIECAAGNEGCSGNPAPGEEVWTAAPSRAMAERIDYVFVRPGAGCALRVNDAARIADEPSATADGRYLWPSDHYGFVVEPGC